MSQDTTFFGFEKKSCLKTECFDEKYYELLKEIKNPNSIFAQKIVIGVLTEKACLQT